MDRGEKKDKSSDQFNKEFSYLYDVCISTKQKIYIGRYILNHPELFNRFENCRRIIIDALFHSAAINLWKINDQSEEINVVHFGNQYRKRDDKEEKEKWKSLKPKQEDLNQLKVRRNKNLAHSDCENIQVDVSKEFPLYIETLERVVKANEMMLEYIYKAVNPATSLSGVDQRTGEHFTLLDMLIKSECENGIRYAKEIVAMQKYMKEHCLGELFNIIYSEGVPEKWII